MKILNAQQIREADQATIQNEPIASIDLMERAAYKCFMWLSDQDIDDKKIHVFCGMGNNGGDGLVIARYLFENGISTSIYVVHFSDKMSDDFVTNFKRAEEIGITPVNIHSADDFPVIDKNDIAIDAIFGTGLSKPPRDIAEDVIKHINSSATFVYSIDVPSGLFIDKHVEEKSKVIQSNITLTFQNPKLAFLLPDNWKYVNDFVIIDIGLDKDFIANILTKYHYTTVQPISKYFKKRIRFSHKGSFGHTLIIGGSFGKIGATVLASRAALKIGSGLVTTYVPKCGYEILQTAIPEVMVEVDAEHNLEFFNFKVKPTVIGIGVGMGTSNKTAKAFGKFLRSNETPLVIDADALNIISKNPKFLNYLPDDTILTPHPKELERLIGKWVNDYEKLDMIKEFSKEHKCIIVSKGAHTIVVQNDNFYFNSSGNPALATAGSGDVLTGIISGLLAQSYSALEAALLGVFIHGRTADIADLYNVKESFIASDIIKLLPHAINDVLYNFDEDSNFQNRGMDINDTFPDDYFFDDDFDDPF